MFLGRVFFYHTNLLFRDERTFESKRFFVKTIKKHHDMPIIAGGSFVSNNIDIAKKVLEVDGLEFDVEKIKSYINNKRNSN